MSGDEKACENAEGNEKDLMLNAGEQAVKEDWAAGKIKLYKRRWIVLSLFACYAASSAMQWVEYSIITNIVMRYYSITSVAVDWTSIISMITYPPLFIPGTYIIDKMGLRVCALLGVTGTALGTLIKVFSIRPDLFYVGFIGQTVVFVSQIFILSLPSKIAAVWFGADEVSTACSIGVFGTQLGTAVGFIVPPMVVKNHDNLDDIGNELSVLFYAVAIFTTPLVILVYLFVQAEPPLPPSINQLEQRRDKVKFSQKQFWASYKTLFSNKPFLLLMLSYGMNIGVFAAVCTLLNQFILSYFPNSEEDAGRIGLLIVVIGMAGSVIFGVFLDRTKKYKETTLALYILTTVGVAAFMFALETHSKPLVYVAASIMGFFQNAYYPAGFELGVELTYPQPESTSSGLLMSMVQIFGTIYTLMLGWLFAQVGAFWALAVMVALLVMGTLVTVVTPNELRRQNAQKGYDNKVQL